ncbi:hypothetical protein HK104_005091, partial [Borealophlyctis nickersoniae]
MRLAIPKEFKHIGDSLNPLTFRDVGGSTIEIRVLDHDLVNVVHLPPGAKPQPSFTAIPESGSADPFGVPRFVLHARFPCPVPTLQIDGDVYTLCTAKLCLVISLKNGDFTISWRTAAKPDEVFAQELGFRAYEYDKAGGAHHFMKRMPENRYYGLGERASPLLLNKRRFRLEALDALGYDAAQSDPLYKVTPMYLTLNADTCKAHAIFYDTLAAGTIDFGCEIDALWGPYTAYRSKSPVLDYTLFYGPSIEKCVESFASRVGKPAMPPKYALGYLASAMGYAEAENAQELIEAFPDVCRKWDIPCDLLHLSSGYTGRYKVDPKTGARNVFTWNSNRFPDPKRMFQKLKAAGIKTVANVKPWLLSLHPEYQAMAARKGFVWDPERNAPSETRLWSAGEGDTCTGSYIDFSSAPGRTFWKTNCQTLLTHGLDGIWNDNNEYSIPDDSHTYAGDGTPLTVGEAGRPLQTLLMATASYEAIQEARPTKRPFVISRSAAPGVQRYAAQTWSGDNETSWHTLKHNIPMGLNAGLSLLPVGYGHDVGGFVGPRPSPELFVRWVQNGIFHPRFCIHSWKHEG